MQSRIWNALFFVALATASVQAAVIGNWNGSNRSWNSFDMSTLHGTITSAGHTILPDGPISAATLAAMDVFVIGEASSAPSAAELSDLSSWVSGGGILLVFFDSGCNGCTGGNAVLSGLGTGMSASGGAAGTTLVGGNFASEGPPYNLVGQTLGSSPGTGISGGTSLAGSYLHYAVLGSGYVFAFGDRLDHNTFIPTAATVNGQLFLNIAGGATGGGGEIPEPSTALLLAGGLAALAGLTRRR